MQNGCEFNAVSDSWDQFSKRSLLFLLFEINWQKSWKIYGSLIFE